MKNYIIVIWRMDLLGQTIEFLKKTRKKIISIDNYTSGSLKNHIKSPHVKYINSNTININKVLLYIRAIHSIFHFENLREYIKVLKNLTNALNQIQ